MHRRLPWRVSKLEARAGRRRFGSAPLDWAPFDHAPFDHAPFDSLRSLRVCDRVCDGVSAALRQGKRMTK